MNLKEIMDIINCNIECNDCTAGCDTECSYYVGKEIRDQILNKVLTETHVCTCEGKCS